jgi:hypothetical protein
MPTPVSYQAQLGAANDDWESMVSGVVQMHATEILKGFYPDDFKNYLACPFERHNPKRYANVRNACHGTGSGKLTCGYGFKELKDVV